jgi:hypothetical protein
MIATRHRHDIALGSSPGTSRASISSRAKSTCAYLASVDNAGESTALRDESLTFLIVEQITEAALAIADCAYVLEQGRIALEGRAADLLRNAGRARAYLGQTRESAPSPSVHP